MVEVLLLREHTHAGRNRVAGETIALTKDEAEFLIKQGVAKLADANKPVKGK